MSTNGNFAELLNAMKHAAGILRDEGVEFALAGGLAIYAHGGPESDHDVDFILLPREAERAVAVLEQAGWRSERPPEGWLYKVYDESGAMIDLIFQPNNQPENVVVAMLARADKLEVFAIEMKVLSVTDVLASKLLALKEHELDYAPAIEIARATRELVDWDVLRELTGDWPYAGAFFTLAQDLGLTQP